MIVYIHRELIVKFIFFWLTNYFGRWYDYYFPEFPLWFNPISTKLLNIYCPKGFSFPFEMYFPMSDLFAIMA